MNVWILAALLSAAHAAAPAYVWEVRDSLSAPESALVVPRKGWVLISNVAGDPAGKDGEGWIAKASLDGKMLDAQWIIGLNAPKGMAVQGDKLYVADIDELAIVSLSKGKVLRRVRVQGAKMLNDVVAGPGGAVYVSDTMGDRVYRLRKDKPEVFLEGPQLESPNGLWVKDGELVVAAWGAGIGPDWSTKAPGRLLAFDLETKARREISEPLGNLDGVAWDRAWYVSDWIAGKVFRIGADGKAETFLEGFKGSADLAISLEPHLLIVPRMGEDAVSAYPL